MMLLDFWIRLLSTTASRVLEGTTVREREAAEVAEKAKCKLATAQAQKSRAKKVTEALAS